MISDVPVCTRAVVSSISRRSVHREEEQIFATRRKRSEAYEQAWVIGNRMISRYLVRKVLKQMSRSYADSPVSMEADSYLRGIIIPTISLSDRPSRRAAPTYFPTCNVITRGGALIPLSPYSSPPSCSLARNSEHVHLAPTPLESRPKLAGILLKLSSSFDAKTCDGNRTRKEWRDVRRARQFSFTLTIRQTRS